MSGYELHKPIDLSHPSRAGDDHQARGFRIRAVGPGYLYGCAVKNHRGQNLVSMVEVTAMRECAVLGTDPAVTTRPWRRCRAGAAATVGRSTAFQLHVLVPGYEQHYSLPSKATIILNNILESRCSHGPVEISSRGQINSEKSSYRWRSWKRRRAAVTVRMCS